MPAAFNIGYRPASAVDGPQSLSAQSIKVAGISFGEVGALQDALANYWAVDRRSRRPFDDYPESQFLPPSGAYETCSLPVEPSVILVVQGAKQLILGGEAYPYSVDGFLITSLDLPANSETVIASPDKPSLGLALKLDVRIIADLIAQGGLPPAREPKSDRSIGIGVVSRPCWRPSGIWSSCSTSQVRSQSLLPYSNEKSTTGCS